MTLTALLWAAIVTVAVLVLACAVVAAENKHTRRKWEEHVKTALAAAGDNETGDRE